MRAPPRARGIYFHLKHGNHFGHRLAPGRITLPAPLDHLPHGIGEFGMVGPSWPTSV